MTMNTVLSTLFYPLEHGALDEAPRPFTACVLNAAPHPALEALGAAHLFLQQYFKPPAWALQEEGRAVSSEINFSNESCDAVFMALPKNKIEAEYMSARALQMLKPGGLIFCAADNKAGGGRIKKMLQNFGVEVLQELSKNKARVVWGAHNNVNKNTLEDALTKGLPQTVLGDDYLSVPGIFGWNKIDKGSEILLQHLPNSLKGKGADFGCGYGYLSRNILQRCENVRELLCIDADYRAMKMCQKNLDGQRADVRLSFFWEDLTQHFPGHTDLDFIVMNPPFHEGAKTDSDIGKAFIETASKSLAPGGVLWMVANAQLPYEDVLQKRFSSFSKEYEGAGFKVYCAKK